MLKHADTTTVDVRVLYLSNSLDIDVRDQTHVARVLAKLGGVRDRVQAVVLACRSGLVR